MANKIDMKAALADGLMAAEAAGGFMLAHGMTRLIPIQNDMVRNVIPVGVGAVGLVAAQLAPEGAQSHIKAAAVGIAAYGIIASIRGLLTDTSMPGGDEGTMGIGGIGENPMVQKFLDNFVPTLGSTSLNTVVDYNSAYDPNYEANLVEDISYESLNGGLDDLDQEFMSLGSAQMDDLDRAFLERA